MRGEQDALCDCTKTSMHGDAHVQLTPQLCPARMAGMVHVAVAAGAAGQPHHQALHSSSLTHSQLGGPSPKTLLMW